MEHKSGNIGLSERMASGAIGGFLAMWAIGSFQRKYSFRGSLAAATSAALLARSVSGYCPIYAALLEPDPQTALSEEAKQIEAIEHSATLAAPEELTLPAFEEAVRTRHRDSEALVTVGSYVRVPQF